MLMVEKFTLKIIHSYSMEDYKIEDDEYISELLANSINIFDEDRLIDLPNYNVEINNKEEIYRIYKLHILPDKAAEQIYLMILEELNAQN